MTLCRLLLLSLWVITPSLVLATEASQGWHKLSFQRKSMWGNVDAELQLQALQTGADQQWQLSVDSTVGNNNEEQVTLQLKSLDGQIVDKQRYSRGRKNRRFKSFDYRGKTIARLRKDPIDGEQALPLEQWSKSTKQQIEYPELPAGAVLTTPYVLFLVVTDPRLATTGGEVTVFVHTDFNVYQVTLFNSGEEAYIASYILNEGEEVTRYRKQSVTVDHIQLKVTPFSEPARPDFEVMGLTGEISFLVEQESRLPVQIQGHAPRVGDTHIHMIGAHY